MPHAFAWNHWRQHDRKNALQLIRCVFILVSIYHQDIINSSSPKCSRYLDRILPQLHPEQTPTAETIVRTYFTCCLTFILMHYMYTANTNQVTHIGKAVHAAITQRHHFSHGWNNLYPLTWDANDRGVEGVLGRALSSKLCEWWISGRLCGGADF